jgi:hypothetical protein
MPMVAEEACPLVIVNMIIACPLPGPLSNSRVLLRKRERRTDSAVRARFEPSSRTVLTAQYLTIFFRLKLSAGTEACKGGTHASSSL